VEPEIVSLRLLTVIAALLNVTLPTGLDVAALKVAVGQRYNVPFARCVWEVLPVHPILNWLNVMLPPVTLALKPISITCDCPEVMGVVEGCNPPVRAANVADWLNALLIEKTRKQTIKLQNKRIFIRLDISLNFASSPSKKPADSKAATHVRQLLCLEA